MPREMDESLRALDDAILEEEKTWRDSELMAAVEALLFTAGDPLEPAVMAKVLEAPVERCREAAEQLAAKYLRDPQSGLSVRAVKGRFALSIKPERGGDAARMFRKGQVPALTPAAYEVLAAVLYNQPVTRAQISELRGVQSDSLVGRLEERGLIVQCGVLEQVGRPALFEVTEQCLLDFGIQSAEEVPALALMMYDRIRSFETR